MSPPDRNVQALACTDHKLLLRPRRRDGSVPPVVAVAPGLEQRRPDQPALAPGELQGEDVMRVVVFDEASRLMMIEFQPSARNEGAPLLPEASTCASRSRHGIAAVAYHRRTPAALT